MRPLSGIEVVSLAFNVPGPVAAARLSELGASVVKVEPPSGDPLRRHAPRWYTRLTKTQTILRLDLKSREGKSELRAKLEGADLLLTSSRPAALARLGLDFPTLHPALPRLCAVRIVGFPSPAADVPGHDLSFQAAAGLVVDPPRMPFTLLSDLAGAERAVAEAIAALFHRERSGEATLREVSLAEAARSMAPPDALRLCIPGGPLGGASPGYRLYEVEDGWIALAALEPHFLVELKRALAIETVTVPRLRAAFRRRTGAWCESWGRRNGIPITKVRRARTAR